MDREAAKPEGEALCIRVYADLYWTPPRDRAGHVRHPPPGRVLEAVTGPGFGAAGHSAGCATGWLTHAAEELAPIAVVGSPPATSPLSYASLCERSNRARRALNPLEVAYLEAVRFFDACAEVDWDEALRITAGQVEHHRILRPEILMEVAGAERCEDASRVLERIRRLCAVVTGAESPPAGMVMERWPGRPAVLEAAHLPALMQCGESGRVVGMSQFVKDWARWPDRWTAMCEREPAGSNRLDLVRIAATVHALCNRDGVAVPDWVWRYRWHEDVRIYARRPLTERDRAHAVPSCRYHRVWFREDHIIDFRVHGFWSRIRTA